MVMRSGARRGGTARGAGAGGADELFGRLERFLTLARRHCAQQNKVDRAAFFSQSATVIRAVTRAPAKMRRTPHAQKPSHPRRLRRSRRTCRLRSAAAPCSGHHRPAAEAARRQDATGEPQLSKADRAAAKLRSRSATDAAVKDVRTPTMLTLSARGA
jgi:hypothetical protein